MEHKRVRSLVVFWILASSLLWAAAARSDGLELPRISAGEFEKYLAEPEGPRMPPGEQAAAETPPAPPGSPPYRVNLRRKSQELAIEDIKRMVLKYNFYDKFENPSGHFANDFIDNRDDTVTDRVTGLMWMKSVMRCCSRADVQQYMSSLTRMNNGRGFRGYTDWRVPTAEELASLLEYNRLNQTAYMGALFDAKKGAYFSADIILGLNMPWIVFFEDGYIGTGGNGACFYLRPVRSVF
jgi:hypothetical protein